MSLGLKIGRLVALILVTLVAGAVMWASGKGWDPTAPTVEESKGPSVAELPPSPVTLRHVQPQTLQITDKYSGTLKPWERFRFGFDINGRVTALGKNPKQQPLDEGDFVSKGQVLAELDNRHLAARQREVEAMLRKAEDEFERAKDLRQVNERAISDALLLTRETDYEMAAAQLEMAIKAVEDATLRSPIDGVISKRMINPGEPVQAQQMVFEIVQTDRLLFTAGVPESRVRAMVERFRDVRTAQEAGNTDETFEVEIQMVGADALGRRWQPVTGSVHSISETSDDTSGMFTVEVEVDNQKRLLRPGQIGVGEFVVAEIEGFRLPSTSAVVRSDVMVLFYGKASDGVRGPVAMPTVADQLVAGMHVLRQGSYLEQGEDLILMDLPQAARNVVVRGQHRLVADARIVVATVQTDDTLGASPNVANNDLDAT